MKHNTRLVILGLSFTAIIFLGLLTSQVLAIARPQNWPSWDNWRETTPEIQGMDSSKIEEMYGFIETNEIDIQSVLIIRNGYIINEEYLYNSVRQEEKRYYWPEADPYWDLRDGRLHAVWSVTKSVVSLLIGVAIEKGFLDLDTKFFDVFPDKWDSVKYGDPVYFDAKRDITVENLLLQNVGIQWNEFDPATIYAWTIAGFSLDYYLTKPLDYLPGTDDPLAWTYSSGNAEMLSVILANKTGMTMAQFAREYLFKPLKIRDSEWDWMSGPSAWGTEDLATKYHGGFGLFMTHRAMARIGLMLLNQGKWHGRQVVSEDWVETSTSALIDRLLFGVFPIQYGYLWWVTPGKYYQAFGANTQRIIVLPEHDIVVVFTANDPNDLVWSSPVDSLLIDSFIIPAVL
ncbi:MAG: serine hydrolase domain-containing protein [Candidatus Thorarchaeota archaeon]|jgi:CubicO group peptidase (beta-lactamase class C family)